MRIFTLLVLVVFLAGCAPTAGTNVPGAEVQGIFSPLAEQAETEKYKIGIGDVLAISVWRNPDLSLTVPVRPDGFVSMPLLGDIRASGLDAEALAEQIAGLLEDQLRNPQVTIVVSQVNSNVYSSRVRVTGAVRNQLSLPYARGMSVLDVILEAGGITEIAAGNRTRLFRTVDGNLYNIEIFLDDILLRGRLDTNFPLMPGDVITVPEGIF